MRRAADRAELDGLRLPRGYCHQCRALARHPVLHLERRSHRQADGRRGSARGGARREGARAGRRHRRPRQARPLPGRGPAPEHRGADLQSVLQPLGLVRAVDRMDDPRPPPQPADAQQGLDRRQPDRDRRRAKHRRRVFRRLRSVELRRPGPGAGRTHRRPDQRVVRRVLEQPERRARGPLRAQGAAARGPDAATRGREGVPPHRRREPVHRRASRRAEARGHAGRAAAAAQGPRDGSASCWSTIPRRSASN